MNLRLEINTDKHSNLKDFICSLKLRCTSEKKIRGRSSRSDTLTCIYLLLIFFLRRGTVCKLSARRLIHRAGLLYSFSFFLSALETELLYYTPAPNVFALESTRKPFFFFLVTNTKCLGLSCTPLGQALSLLTVFMCDFGGLGCACGGGGVWGALLYQR